MHRTLVEHRTQHLQELQLDASMEQIRWLASEMEEVTLIETTSVTNKSCPKVIFYDYFVHLDDQSQVKPSTKQANTDAAL